MNNGNESYNGKIVIVADGSCVHYREFGRWCAKNGRRLRKYQPTKEGRWDKIKNSISLANENEVLLLLGIPTDLVRRLKDEYGVFSLLFSDTSESFDDVSEDKRFNKKRHDFSVKPTPKNVRTLIRTLGR